VADQLWFMTRIREEEDVAHLVYLLEHTDTGSTTIITVTYLLLICMRICIFICSWRLRKMSMCLYILVRTL